MSLATPTPTPRSAAAPAVALRQALARGRAALRPAARFALWYGPAVGGAVALHLWWTSHGLGGKAMKVLAIFGAGALVGGFLAWVLAAMLAGGARSAGRRAAVMLVLLVIGTAGTVALIYFIDFRSYFAQFHDTTFSRDWLVEMLFTGAGALYVFASMGLRLMLPAGLPLLFIGAALFARATRTDRA